jgi:hypothetical protein
VEKEPKATRAGNARLHGMTSVTLPSIAYIATQVWPVITPLRVPALFVSIGPICLKLLASLFENRHGHWFRVILQLSLGFVWWRRWETGGWWIVSLVEPVCSCQCINVVSLITNFTVKFFPATLRSALLLKIAPLLTLDRNGRLWRLCRTQYNIIYVVFVTIYV